MPMKYTLSRVEKEEEEIIVKYHEMTPELVRILNFLNMEQRRLLGWKGKTATVLEPANILYIESVDGRIFAYTDEDVLQIDCTLSRLEQLLGDISFFRSSKSMIINIDRVGSLKSLPSNRIDATMSNGEHIMISRTYASDFRKRLKGGAYDGQA